MQSRNVRASLGAVLLFAALALSGCSPSDADPEATDNASNDSAATAFVACLMAEGQSAKILDGGYVGILMSEDIDLGEPNAGGSPVIVVMDDDGEWVAPSDADGLPEDGGLRDAWAACADEVPEFVQPEPTMSGGDPTAPDAEEQMEIALAFAECARESGYPDWPDPDENGAMAFPDGLTEDGFRSVLEDCFDPDSSQGFALSKEVVDSLSFDVVAVIDDYLASIGYEPEGGQVGGSGGPGSGGD
jgi:hypothetical protein